MADPTTPATGTTSTAATTTTPTPPAGAAAATQPTTSTTTPAPSGEGKPQETTPSVVELKFPDGVAVDKGLVDKFMPIVKEFKLTSPQAQKLADLYTEAVQTYSTKATEAHQVQVQNWLKECKEDKEFGGTNFDANRTTAMKAVERFGGTPLKDFFNTTGLGNNPMLFRAFTQIGRAISEDSAATKTGTASRQMSEQEKLAVRYPSMFNADGTPK